MAMFTKYLVVVDDDVDVHNASEVLFRLCANTDPQRDSIFTKGPSDVLDHATSEIASGSKLGVDVTRKLPCAGFKRPWPLLVKMNEGVRPKILSAPIPRVRPSRLRQLRLYSVKQPRPRIGPPAFGGGFGDTEDFGGFLDLQA